MLMCEESNIEPLHLARLEALLRVENVCLCAGKASDESLGVTR
jgi:hypothetical protein